MKFKPLFLYGNLETGETDELNNPITRPSLIAKSTGRFTQWTAEEIALDTHGITKTARKILTLASEKDCRVANKVMIEETNYQISEVRDYDRWRLLVVKAYRM